MRIKSKFPSVCSACNQPIAPGTDIEWEPGTKPSHVQCPVPVRTFATPPPAQIKPKFVLALERIAQSQAVVAPSQARGTARDHFVRTLCAVGHRPAALQLPVGEYEEIVLTVGPKARVMERALVREGRDVLYLRYNGGDLVDTTVNNVPLTQEIGWVAAWSPVVQMAVEGIRVRA